MPKDETFPLPLKYIDVPRSTQTDLDVLQEKRITDFWNVDVDRSLSDSWTGLAKFTLLNEKPPPRNMWSRSALHKIKELPDLIICGLKIWIGMSKAAQKKEKQECYGETEP